MRTLGYQYLVLSNYLRTLKRTSCIVLSLTTLASLTSLSAPALAHPEAACGKTPDSDDTPPRRQTVFSGIMSGKSAPFVQVGTSFGRLQNQELQLDALKFGLIRTNRASLALVYQSTRGEQSTEDGKFSEWLGGLSFGDVSQQFTDVLGGFFSFFWGTGRAKFRDEESSYRSRFLLIAQPEIGLTVNLIDGLQLGAGVGYRLVGNSKVGPLQNRDFQGWIASFHLTVGAF